jgi:molybdate transport system regulatory protein
MTCETCLIIGVEWGIGRQIGLRQIALLEAIQAQGSISGAARHLGCSYRGARLLIEDINEVLRESAVSCQAGGYEGGGATLTTAGTELVSLYRAIEARVQAVTVPERGALDRLCTNQSVVRK